MTRNRISLIAVLGGLVAVAGGALIARAIWGDRGSRARGPNILLVTFDTTRADHIGAYGWRHGRTPAIDRLSEQGVLFDRAYAPIPLTLPSHATMLTGMYPFYIDVRDNSHFQLDERARTLAEMLRGHGYQTGAVVAAFVLDARFGLDQGFDEYRDEVPERAKFAPFEIPERNAEAVVDDALDWLRKTDKDRPFFLWCHFYDPHHPYRTPESFPFYQRHPYDMEIAFADHHLQRLLDQLEQTPPNDRPMLVVLTADHGEALGEHGEETHGYFVYDSTLHVPLVIRLPDGSGAGRRIDAPVSLVDVMPTILELAGLPVPGEDEIHGRSLVGLLEGSPNAPGALKRRSVYFECYTPMYDFGWAPVRGIRLDQTKFIESPIPELYLLADNPREGQAKNVYPRHPDVARRLSDELQTLLSTPLRQPPLSGDVQDVDPEVIQNLQALGYLAGGVAEEEEEWGPEDDAKSRLAIYNLVLSAVAQLGEGNVATGTRMLLRVLAEDAENPRALSLLAEAVATDPERGAEGLPALEAAARNSKLGAAARAQLMINCGRTHLIRQDPQRALTYFANALALQPENPIFLGWLAVAHMHLGRLGQAADATRKAVTYGPQIDHLQVQLGLLSFCSGQAADGAERWHRLLVRDNDPVSPWTVAGMCARDPVIAAQALEALTRVAADQALSAEVRGALHTTVGEILFSAGRFESALDALRTAAALLRPDDPLGLWWQAQALVALKRLDEALPLLERARELDPGEILVVADLASVYSETGRGADAVVLLADFQETRPDDPTAANNLAWMLAEQSDREEDLDRALDLAKFAVRRRRSSSAFTDTLGWIHLRRGDGKSAVFAFARATQLDSTNATYQYHLGLAYRLDDQGEKAREAFGRAVELAPTPRPDWYEDAVEGVQPGNE